MHIWTYANGLNLLDSRICNCSCDNGNTFDPPPFVGSDYYCESGDNVNTCCDYSNDRIHCGADSNVLEGGSLLYSSQLVVVQQDTQ